MKLPLLTGYEERNSLFDLTDEVLYRLPTEKRVVITTKNKQIADEFAQLLVYETGPKYNEVYRNIRILCRYHI